MDCKKILFEFEKRYNGIPERTSEICGDIAKEFGLNLEEVEDCVYIYRYNEGEENEE